MHYDVGPRVLIAAVAWYSKGFHVHLHMQSSDMPIGGLVRPCSRDRHVAALGGPSLDDWRVPFNRNPYNLLW